MLAASAAFRAAGDPATAADVVGAMLTRWHYLALAAPLLLLALEWRRLRTAVIVVVFAAIVIATLQALIDLRIRALRMQSDVPISSLPQRDPLRRRFGILHATSSMLLLGEVIGAACAVGAIERDDAALRDRLPVEVDLVDREP